MYNGPANQDPKHWDFRADDILSDRHNAYFRYSEQIIDRRNLRMTDKIRMLLKGKEKFFVVVGAAHYVGEQGIVAMLKKDGLKVEQPAVTEAVAPQPGTR